jgi:thiosulfate dehydrogenase
MIRRVAPLGLAVGLSGCGTAPGPAWQQSPEERGQALFESRQLSPASSNVFSCSTCHDARPSGDAPIKPGAPLAGATERPLFWGGQENDLLLSIDACRSTFMRAPAPLAPDDAQAEALYAYLVSLEPGDPRPAPFTVVREIADVPRGDAARGPWVFERACAACHGTLHEGVGRLGLRVPVLPEETLAAHPAPDYSPRVQRLVFIEKTRHGGFLGYGGFMPPFSLEVLPDPDLSDLLEALGVVGGS